jgi:hypothetical protein
VSLGKSTVGTKPVPSRATCALPAVVGTDENGHGTHVAGTCAGMTYGVAKAVSLGCALTAVAAGHERRHCRHPVGGEPTRVDVRRRRGRQHCRAQRDQLVARGASLNSAVANAVKAGIVVVVAAATTTRTRRYTARQRAVRCSRSELAPTPMHALRSPTTVPL